MQKAQQTVLDLKVWTVFFVFIQLWRIQHCTEATAYCLLLMLEYFPKPNLIPHSLILHMKGSVMMRICYVRIQ